MKRLFSTLLTLTFILFTFSASIVEIPANWTSLSTFADELSEAPAAPAVPGTSPANEITEECVSLEYTTIEYSGAEKKPKVTVAIGGVALAPDTDFTVKYPEDCTNAGRKNLTVSGMGSYTGSVTMPYTVSPLDCSEGSDVTVNVSDCSYSGLPRYPEITVKRGDLVIPRSEYSVTLSDNVEVGSKAKCVLKFRGNYKGERTVYFNILKRVVKSCFIDLIAKPGQVFSIDLSKFKPEGAVFGKPYYSASDFAENNMPRVAFNVLRFQLSPESTEGATIAILMTNMKHYENFWLEFFIYLAEDDLPVPQLVVKPIETVYTGDPLSAEEFEKNGSYAYYNGQIIKGEWDFSYHTKVPTLPCNKELVIAKFTPDDPQYSHAYAMAQATILRKEVPEFDVEEKYYRLNPGEALEFSATGIPDDFDGSVTLTAPEGDTFSVLSETQKDGTRTYKVEFPKKDAYHTLNVTLGGSAFYAPKTIELDITVGYPQETPPENAPTTERELASLIAKAEADSTVKADLMTSISEKLLKSAAEKRLVIEVKTSENITLVLEPAKMKNITDLDLDITPAVIPQVLLDELGDEKICAFTSFMKNSSGISIKAPVKSDLPVVCFYLYSTSGELERIVSIPKNGESVRLEFPGSGKYVITASRTSHITCDFDNNCIISLKDVSRSIAVYMEMTDEPTEEQIKAIDFDGNGKITLSDISDLIKYYMEL